MRDFTLHMYRQYIGAIKSSFDNILRFDEYMVAPNKYGSFCLIRHDVDRKPKNALRMAELEREAGISSSYYFRAKDHTFKPAIIKEIHNLGHEIGYHYESLSDENGEMEKAMKNFEINLDKFRKIVAVKTISMHGRPFSPFNNRDLLKDNKNHKTLLNELDILGEVYLDIDYSDITYITDTGRNWNSHKNNVRDKVFSLQSVDFNNGNDLLKFFSSPTKSKLVFQVHPERWSSNILDYYRQYMTDNAVNILKYTMNFISKRRKQ